MASAEILGALVGLLVVCADPAPQSKSNAGRVTNGTPRDRISRDPKDRGRATTFDQNGRPKATGGYTTLNGQRRKY